MYSKLCEKLAFSLPPVAIYFTDDKPENAAQFEPKKRGCVMTMLAAASKGKTAVFDENTYGCAGGGVGLCFGDVYTKTGMPIECLLSTGDAALKETGQEAKMSFGIGERFFASPEIGRRFRDNFQFAEAPEKYVVFKPLSQADEADPPALIYIFANPDQLSALVTMLGFYTGEANNAIAPFGGACQSVVLAYNESKKEKPKAVLGLFDVSQRHRLPKELLSLTLSFDMFKTMDGSVDESCLITEAWESIEGRF